MIELIKFNNDNSRSTFDRIQGVAITVALLYLAAPKAFVDEFEVFIKWISPVATELVQILTKEQSNEAMVLSTRPTFLIAFIIALAVGVYFYIGDRSGRSLFWISITILLGYAIYAHFLRSWFQEIMMKATTDRTAVELIKDRLDQHVAVAEEDEEEQNYLGLKGAQTDPRIPKYRGRVALAIGPLALMFSRSVFGQSFELALGPRLWTVVKRSFNADLR
jgi:hypothetical protein